MEFTIADFPYTQMQKEWGVDAEPGEHPSADISEMPQYPASPGNAVSSEVAAASSSSRSVEGSKSTPLNGSPTTPAVQTEAPVQFASPPTHAGDDLDADHDEKVPL
jgi:hypothetical protein